MSITEAQNIPVKKWLLLLGVPGSGKSVFCQQVAINGIAVGLPVIYVTSECTTEELETRLKNRGLGESFPESLAIVDAYTQTVGLSCKSHGKTLCANCADLNSLSMAITKLRGRLSGDRVLLVFDSLTSPYLFNGLKVVRFIQQFLVRFAQEGNAVMAAIDAGCGKESDMVAMTSLADGILQLEIEGRQQYIRVIKHPDLAPSRFERLLESKFEIDTILAEGFDPDFMRMYVSSLFFGRTCLRPHLGDYVNALWPKLAYWSSMLWDPSGFPLMIYENTREDQSATGSDIFISILPQPYKAMFSLINILKSTGIFPKDFSSVREMKRVWFWGFPYKTGARLERYGNIEYLPEISEQEEHYYRIYENSDCWGLDGVGEVLASYLPPAMAGHLTGLEGRDRNWHAIETKCLGLGDPYCEVKLVPYETNEVKQSLRKDPETVARIHKRLIENFAAYILNGKALKDRSHFGPLIHLQIPFHTFGFAHIAGDRSKVAIRMGGAKSGKEIAELLLTAKNEPDQVIQHVFKSLETLKAGIVTARGGKVRIEENIEPLRTKYMTTLKEPSCYFTTGFLSGLYQSVYGLQVKETKCIVAGGPYCEWEII